MAAAAGIKVAQAQPGRIARTIEVFGRLVVPPEQHASIQARFPGVVMQVKVSAGDRVSKGQLLAIVESNDSLRSYEIKAPLDAWVASRKLNVGEQTGETPLFELVDDRQLVAELKIFHRYRSDVAVGQPVRLKVGQVALEAQIAALVRAGDSVPFVTARVPVANGEGVLIAGDLVQAQIVIEEREASLVIANRALQTFENKSVVFVRDGETYASRPLALGSSDGRYTEVLQGLEEGENYVVENSYLIKADLEKAGAAHEH
ncbi:MAG: HlyD family efflux transporter periplasmic adaptor subunit [Cellvibrionaceae bacterium]|nr:HlyD family efflux transporter periplasmic adaptor subunit [Cellvibrionaceae bacterium]